MRRGGQTDWCMLLGATGLMVKSVEIATALTGFAMTMFSSNDRHELTFAKVHPVKQGGCAVSLKDEPMLSVGHRFAAP